MSLPHVDHIILLVHDLEKTRADLTGLGFVVQERADTKHGGTAFLFISFEDGSYILLTSFTKPEAAASHRLGPVLAEGEGWADYSFVVDNLDAAIARARAAGVTLGDVHDVNNVVQSGETWGLRLLVAGRGAEGDDALPFFVQDVSGRDIRIPKAVSHPNGALGVSALMIGAPDPAATAKGLAALLGAPTPAMNDGAYELTAGPCRLRIIANRDDLPGRRSGGGLVDASIRTATGGKAGALDLTLAHGARMTLEAVR